ncbi:hypothetical protein ON010_g17016 [Phytophthora cinnamomi]|nr:hypothetical protein ON010_g17016 [Phytophthora cinnamomi]
MGIPRPELRDQVCYEASECSWSLFTTRSLNVWLPERDLLVAELLGADLSRFSDTDRETLVRKQFQKTREVMALLAAVAHVDYAAWRYLLEKSYLVDFVAEEKQRYEEEVPIRYLRCN